MKNMLLAGVGLFALLAAAPAFADDIKQGGEMTVAFKDDMATLDPAIGYDWQNWSIIKSLYSRLMDYEPGTTNLRPDLAESFDVSPDGLTYTFKLRTGVKFHNGRELTADDVRLFARPHGQPEDPEPRRRLLPFDQGLRRRVRRQGRSPRRRDGRRSVHREDRARQPRRDVPARDGAELRFGRRQGGRREVGRRLRPSPGRQRRLLHDGLDARPADRAGAQ